MNPNRTGNEFDSEADESTVARRLSNSAGQSGDIQESSTDEPESEGVTELLEDGQYFEAAAVSGIENAPAADIAEVRTRQFREDDVPPEYLEDDDPPR